MLQTSEGYSYQDILKLFQEGIEECYRILRLGGLLLVKCADESSSGVQYMTHIAVHHMALEFGLLVKVLLLLHRLSEPAVFGRQRVARKNHSYLWVFEKPCELPCTSDGIIAIG